MSTFDGISFPLVCDGCGHEFEELVGRLKTHGARCPNCGATIRLEDSSAFDEMDELINKIPGIEPPPPPLLDGGGKTPDQPE